MKDNIKEVDDFFTFYNEKSISQLNKDAMNAFVDFNTYFKELYDGKKNQLLFEKLRLLSKFYMILMRMNTEQSISKRLGVEIPKGLSFNETFNFIEINENE